MSERINKVNSLIIDLMGKLIARDVSFKSGVLVTISKVDTLRDLHQTHVFISVLPATEVDYVMKTLSREHAALQKKLHKTLYMKILPKLVFHYDDTEERADVVEKLLRDV